MPRKLLLSFLGIQDYEPVSYYLADQRKAGVAPLEKYVQKALLGHLAGSFGADDRAVIFLTDEARATNWEDDGHIDRNTKSPIPNPGLGQLIRAANYPFPVEAVTIDGESEPEAIWRTFQTVYDQFREGDEVYFDITNSWRYLPMLGMTLLNYAKVLKEITVKSIYYGAFERLGNVFEVRQMPEDQRPVPILDLVSFSDLQDWTVAADDFVRDGNPTRLARLTQTNLGPILPDSKGREDVAAANLRAITWQLQQLTDTLATNRGRQLWTFDFPALHQDLADFSAERSHIKPLNGVMDHIRQKLRGFDTTPNRQWLEGVHWCITHGLVQQGITQLWEGTLSWLCTHYEQNSWAEPGYFDIQRRESRNFLSSALQFIQSAPPEEAWRGEIGRRKELAYRIMDDALARELSPVFSGLTNLRNDINHGGYTNDTPAGKFITRLEERYATIRDIIERHSTPTEIGLLNLSNHPSEGWTEPQLATARERFGRVHDLPFPAIDPEMAPEKLQALVTDYFDQITALHPAAVHLMGEMTFTYALVQRLKPAGIPCVASTTHRIAEERDGRKIVRFEFVQFRPY